ncbi:MAG: hypothetical protein KAJ42_15315 [Gemmatimonadetes bacterium]|nr:hypothetical protein [Gemmatimonadota bacterium]
MARDDPIRQCLHFNHLAGEFSAEQLLLGHLVEQHTVGDGEVDQGLGLGV